MIEVQDLLRSLGRKGLRLLNAVVPKQNKAVLCGFPDGEDGILEVASQLSARDDITVVLLVDRVQAFQRSSSNYTQCPKRSLRGLWHYLTARFVFFTHGLYLSPPPPRSQTCVNIWHGMPLKRIGHMIGRVPPYATLEIATSQFFQGPVAAAFGKPVSDVLVTGLPRNDVMVRASTQAERIKRAMGLEHAGKMRQLVVWLPTFRQGVRGMVRTDGRAHESIFGMDDMDLGAFERLLRKHDCVCVAKPHPMAAEFAGTAEGDFIKIWDEDDLSSRGLSLYEVVGAADLLITDASSVYVDYLLLDRPLIIAFPDLEDYKATRGFAIAPIEDYFAGPLVRTFDELAAALDECLLNDVFKARRERIARLFHEKRDNGATERLLNAVLPPRAREGLTRDPSAIAL